MNKTLINPNQCSHYNIPVCKDPTYNYIELGIEINDDLFTPMGMDGRTCIFKSRCTTQDYMQVYKRVLASREIYWDPSTVHYNLLLVENYNRYELYDESPFTSFSNSPCDIDLEHQGDISKRFVNAVKINHGNTERTVSEVGYNE